MHSPKWGTRSSHCRHDRIAAEPERSHRPGQFGSPFRSAQGWVMRAVRQGFDFVRASEPRPTRRSAMGAGVRAGCGCGEEPARPVTPANVPRSPSAGSRANGPLGCRGVPSRVHARDQRNRQAPYKRWQGRVARHASLNCELRQRHARI